MYTDGENQGLNALYGQLRSTQSLQPHTRIIVVSDLTVKIERGLASHRIKGVSVIDPARLDPTQIFNY